MKTVAIIQARMGSTRLPGKVRMDLSGEPMLARVVRRLSRAKRVDEVIVATTVEAGDDAVATLCAERGWPCYRGSENDVLDRYYQAAKQAQAGTVIRITADCPLIEPEIVDQVIAALDGAADYSSNVVDPRTYPRGLDVEAFPSSILERLWHEDQNPAWREHVTELIHQHPERFRLRHVRSERDYSSLRWTVDTPEDFELIRRIYVHFGHDNFGWREVLELLELHPDWVEINRGIVQKVV